MQRNALQERDTSGVDIRAARLTDLDDIERMVNYWANIGENLPRNRSDLVKAVGTFAVTEKHGQGNRLCINLCVRYWAWQRFVLLGIEPGYQGGRSG